MTQKKCPALPPAEREGPAWDQLSEPERMARNANRALEKVRDALELPLDPENARMTAIVMNVALATIATKVRIDENALSQREDRLGAERERALQALVKRLPARFRPANGSEPASDGGQDEAGVREAAAKHSEPR
jgi:hypothetical protein